MAGKTKAPAVAAAQTREEVEGLIETMGNLQRHRKRLQLDYADQAAALKAAAEAAVAPIDDEVASLIARIQGWCAAHRAEITHEGKVKFADFTTGKVTWRTRPPKVTMALATPRPERGTQRPTTVAQAG